MFLEQLSCNLSFIHCFPSFNIKHIYKFYVEDIKLRQDMLIWKQVLNSIIKTKYQQGSLICNC